MPRRTLALAVVIFLSAVGSRILAEETSLANLGKKISNFTLLDVRERRQVSLADFKNKKAVVVVFLGTECPLNNAFLPRLAELHEEFASKGVQLLGINSNRQDSAAAVAAHARKRTIPYPVLKDPGNKVADQFGARRTPEAFVLDTDGKIRYQGRIDDQFGIGFQRPQSTRRDLAEAIDEILAGKAVSQPTTPVAGCRIGREAPTKSHAPITYSKDVARILQKNCQECHRPGQIGPMSLLNYDDAVSWAATIREAVSDDRMPPWHADPRYGKFSNDRRLSAEDKRTLLAWIDQGCAKGDDKDFPRPREFPEGWRIGKPDLVLTMNEEFGVPAKMPKWGVPYKHFEVPTNFNEDRWVQRAEAKPGSPEVVHHIVVFVVPPGKFFNPNDPKNPVLCGTAPGDMPAILAPGMGKKIPAGSRLVFQMHYTPSGKPAKDRSSVGLIFAKEPPKAMVRTVPVFNAMFRIPPGAENYEVQSEFAFQRDGRIVAFMPHMHLRGKDFRYQAIYPDGKKEILLSVPRFNFGWQSVYRLAEPKQLPKGTKVHCLAHFDNSAKNPNNPDAAKTVFWGDQTWEEMMIGWMDFIYDDKVN